MEEEIKVERNYIDLRPTSEWSQNGDAYTLLVDLPDFKKEQINISIDDPSNTLSIRCERPIPGDPWWRFMGDFSVPEKCDIGGMKAKYENGFLHVIFPKVIDEEEDEEDDEMESKKKSKHEVGEKVQVVKGMNNNTKHLILNVVAALLVLVVLIWLSLSHKMRNNYLKVDEE